MDKDFIVIGIGRVFQILLALISVKLMTTFLSEKEVGNYYLITAIIAFFNLVLLNPPGMYFSRHILHWQQTKNILNAVIAFSSFILFISIIGVATSLSIYYILDYNNNFQLAYFLFLVLVILNISTLHRNVLSGINTLGYRRIFVFLSCLTLLLGLMLSITLVLFVNKHAVIWMSGIVGAEAMTLFVTIKVLGKGNIASFCKIRNKLTKSHIRKIMSYCVPVGITTFLLWGQTYAYRFIVESKYSLETLAFIGIGLSVAASIFSAVESISMQYFNPVFLREIMDASEEHRSKTWNDIAKRVVPIYLIITVFVVMLSPYLLRILVGGKFYGAFYATMIGAGIEFFRVMTNLLNMVAQSELKTEYTIKPYLLGSFITIGVLLLFDMKQYYLLIPVTMLIGYFVIFLLMFFNMRKLLRIQYNIKLILFALALSFPLLSAYFFWRWRDSIYSAILITLIFGCYLLFSFFVLIKADDK